MNYIYESPDGGKTIYRRPVGNPTAKRELYRSKSGLYHASDGFDLSITIEDDGTVTTIVS